MSGDHTVTMKLTKRAVDALVAGPERYLAWDIELKGFGVRGSPQGRKTYIVRYRTIGGARRMLTLATSEILTTEEAREEARRALARAAMGGDPQRVKAERRAEMTVRELCELYMEEGTATKKETTLQIDRIRIKRHINPRIGNMKVRPRCEDTGPVTAAFSNQEVMMTKLALYVPLKAKPGKEGDVADFLRSALPLVQQEPGTLTWYAIEEGPGQYAIFDTFETEADRQAHLDGKVAAALMEKAGDLFSEPPQIHKLTLLAAK